MIGYDVENNTYIYLNLYAHNFIQHPKHSAYFKDICPFSLGYYMNCDTINTKIISTLLVTMISVYNKKFRLKHIPSGPDGE